MQIAHTIEEFKQAVSVFKATGKTIGLVPTMGYLHEGHLGLIDEAKQHVDAVILTIFVNPTQFGPNEDLDAYPRNLEGDLSAAENRGVDLVFCPKTEEMYEPDHSIYLIEESVSLGLCGQSRPGHFRGVLTICCKLFNLSQCDIAVFGQKDAQQVTLIEKMVRELNMSVKIIRRKTEREADGLAMSSRNAYLTPSERAIAPVLKQSLQLGMQLVESGETEVVKILRRMREVIESENGPRIDYLEIVDRRTLKPVETAVSGTLLMAGAMFIGKTRLIDNLEV